MTVQYIPTDSDIETIIRMGSRGMNLDMIATAVGVDESTLRVNKHTYKAYTLAFTNVIEQVAEAALTRALEGAHEDNALRIFILKTRARWKDHSYIHSKNIKGNYSEKKAKIDGMLANGELSIENYQKLSNAFTEQYKVDEHETRLKAVEDRLNAGKSNAKENNQNESN